MRIRLAICFTIAAAASIGAGCGGDDENSDQEAISAVLTELRAVQDSGDAAKACTEVYVIQEGQQRAGELAGEADAEPVESEESDEAESEGAEPEAESDGESAGDEGEEGETPAECEEAFEASYERREAEIKSLTTSVGAIEVDGERATATVHTDLQRQDGSLLTQDVPYDLIRTSDGWRVRIADEG